MAYSQMPKRKQQAETAVAEPLHRESLFKPKIKALRWWMMLLIMLGPTVNYLARSTLAIAAPTVRCDDGQRRPIPHECGAASPVHDQQPLRGGAIEGIREAASRRCGAVRQRANRAGISDGANAAA